MYSLLSGPPEVICRILESCDDFPQLFAFISACKGLHSVWMASRGTIIWEIGNRNIVAFDDALIAVSNLTFVSFPLIPIFSCMAVDRDDPDVVSLHRICPTLSLSFPLHGTVY